MNTSNAPDPVSGEQDHQPAKQTRAVKKSRQTNPCTSDVSAADDTSKTSSVAPNDDSSDMRLSLAEKFDYRFHHLRPHNIFILHVFNSLPKLQFDLAHELRDEMKPFPEGAGYDIWDDDELRSLNSDVSESEVQSIFLRMLCDWKEISFERMKCSQRLRLHGKHVPVGRLVSPNVHLSHPVPDLIFGYAPETFAQYVKVMHPLRMSDIVANAENLVLPFLTVEVEAQWPLSAAGNLIVGENRAAVSGSVCVKMMTDVKEHLHLRTDASVDQLRTATTSFTVVTNGSEARLFAVWKEASDYIMQPVRSYCVTEPDHHCLQFRRVIHNILSWGYGERLKAIWACFDAARRTFAALQGI